MGDEQKTTFDFGDGHGPVPAKQHHNPDGSIGGWVAIRASVSAKAFIGIRSRILGGTILGGTILGGTILGGTIEGGTIEGGTIRGGTILGGTILGGTILGGTIRGGEWKTSPLQIQGSKHFINMASKTELQIGCIRLTIDKWREKRFILGEREGYTAEQIEEYGLYIELAAKLYPPDNETE